MSSTASRLGPWAAPLLLLACAALGVARLQPALAGQLKRVKDREDTYVLPPPQHLRAVSLGHVAAAVDLLWAKLIVENGVHHAEHRAFPDMENYFEAILALEPDYRLLYLYADTLIVYRPPRGYEADARTVRRYLERGIKERPYDEEVWLRYGDFLAFVAPSFLEKEEDIATWRREGADALFRAVELGAEVNRALSAAAILGRAGERDAAIRSLQRSYAVTDDPSIKERIAAKLANLELSHERERLETTMQRVEARWNAEAPYLTRTAYLILGPMAAAAACAGPRHADDEACALHWNAEAEVPSGPSAEGR